jgi:hypothetical protein
MIRRRGSRRQKRRRRKKTWLRRNAGFLPMAGTEQEGEGAN